MHKLDDVDAASLRDDIPAFRAGDNIKVHVKVIEGTRSRVQVFQGVVIRRHGGGIGETYTVRKVSFGVGVERTFPLHSPVIEKIELVTRGDVRRAKPVLPARPARQGCQDQGEAQRDARPLRRRVPFDLSSLRLLGVPDWRTRWPWSLTAPDVGEADRSPH